MNDQTTEERWEYVKEILDKHIKLHFREEAVKTFESVPIELYSAGSIGQDEHSPRILLPLPQSDSQVNGYDDQWSVRVGQQDYKLWGRAPAPSGEEWSVWPNAENPLYFRRLNTVVLAFDLVSTAFSLLTLEEERCSETRDKLGRFLAAFSPRREYGLLQYPAINYMSAILVSLSRMLTQDALEPADIAADILPPIVTLSHDVDEISGNSFWLHGSRVVRLFKPLARLKPPDFRQISNIACGICFPRRQHDDFSTYIDIEAKYGAHSSFYFITGRGGRYGARYKVHKVKDKVDLLKSSGHEVGIHMNFHGWDNVDSIVKQRDVLHETFDVPVIGGRGHYEGVDERVGQGHIILYADDPNFRAYWDGLDRLFFNSILFGPSLGR